MCTRVRPGRRRATESHIASHAKPRASTIPTLQQVRHLARDSRLTTAQEMPRTPGPGMRS